MTNIRSPRGGYILIVTVLVVATVLLVLSAAVALGLIGHRTGSRAVDDRVTAQALAESCAEVALLKLKRANTYTGNETMTISGSTCTIHTFSSTLPTTIETEATVNSRPYRLEVTVSSYDPFTVTGWNRVSSF